MSRTYRAQVDSSEKPGMMWKPKHRRKDIEDSIAESIELQEELEDALPEEEGEISED